MSKMIKVITSLALLSSPAVLINPVPGYAAVAAASVITSVKVTTTGGSYNATFQEDTVTIVIPQSLSDTVNITEVRIQSGSAKTISADIFPSKTLKFTNGVALPNLSSKTLRDFLGLGTTGDIPLKSVRDYLKLMNNTLTLNATVVSTSGAATPIKIVVITERQNLINIAASAIQAIPAIADLKYEDNKKVADARMKVDAAIRAGATTKDFAEYAKLTESEKQIVRLTNNAGGGGTSSGGGGSTGGTTGGTNTGGTNTGGTNTGGANTGGSNSGGSNTGGGTGSGNANTGPSVNTAQVNALVNQYNRPTTPASVADTLSKAKVTDVKPDSPAAAAFAKAVSSGLLQPDSQGQLNPTAPPSKNETAAIFAKMMGVAGMTENTGAAAQKAASAGLVDSASAQSNAPITRMEAAALIAKVLNVTPREGSVTPETFPFKDAEGMKGVDMAVIDILYRKGIFQGYEDNTFRPNETLTKEQLAVLIDRVLGAK